MTNLPLVGEAFYSHTLQGWYFSGIFFTFACEKESFYARMNQHRPVVYYNLLLRILTNFLY